MAKLCEEPERDEGSTPDDDAQGKFAGHRGGGEPMKVGVGYTQRELCDGECLASPGRWAPGTRVYPETAHWKDVAGRYGRFADHYGTEQLLASLTMGKVETCPFRSRESGISQTRDHTVGAGWIMAGDRTNVPTDYRFLQLPLKLSDDPETGLGDYSQGVRVGPGTRMPRLPALYKPKRKWRLASQYDAHDYLEQVAEQGSVWRQNYSSLETFVTQVPNRHARPSFSWSSAGSFGVGGEEEVSGSCDWVLNAKRSQVVS